MKRFYERWILNPKAKAIAKLMRGQPGRWRNEFSPISDVCYTLDCGPLKVWMASGWWFVKIYRPKEEKLGVIGRTIVWWQARRLYVARRPPDYQENEAAVRALEREP
ncbi:MAG TPA: hypothetical protein VL027_01980 [Spongiibacteraceae bacterium]|nr:hypothetical protein [Spongiibacteraceae bacterium]